MRRRDLGAEVRWEFSKSVAAAATSRVVRGKKKGKKKKVKKSDEGRRYPHMPRSA